MSCLSIQQSKWNCLYSTRISRVFLWMNWYLHRWTKASFGELPFGELAIVLPDPVKKSLSKFHPQAKFDGFIYCWVLVFASSPCYNLVCVFWGMVRWWVGGLSCGPDICVSWSRSELRVRLAPLNWFKPSSKIFSWPFKGGTSFVDLLCFFLSCVCCAFVSVCLCVPCGHLLGEGWPLGSLLWCPTVSLSLSHWYPASGVVLDCIDSWSLHPYLLWRI